jgi:hypothetical protein
MMPHRGYVPCLAALAFRLGHVASPFVMKPCQCPDALASIDGVILNVSKSEPAKFQAIPFRHGTNSSGSYPAYGESGCLVSLSKIVHCPLSSGQPITAGDGMQKEETGVGFAACMATQCGQRKTKPIRAPLRMSQHGKRLDSLITRSAN